MAGIAITRTGSQVRKVNRNGIGCQIHKHTSISKQSAHGILKVITHWVLRGRQYSGAAIANFPCADIFQSQQPSALDFMETH